MAKKEKMIKLSISLTQRQYKHLTALFKGSISLAATIRYLVTKNMEEN